MLSIASNYCVDLLRKRRALLLSLDQPLPPHPALMSDRADGPEAQTVDSERERMVQTLLEDLSEDYRQAVVLRYWYDLSYEEIADVMDTTVSAIKSRLFRARRQLAELSMEQGMFPTLQPEAE
jgi:RNA polymerase sigma-70 factor (ECF subfamily)